MERCTETVLGQKILPTVFTRSIQRPYVLTSFPPPPSFRSIGRHSCVLSLVLFVFFPLHPSRCLKALTDLTLNSTITTPPLLSVWGGMPDPSFLGRIISTFLVHRRRGKVAPLRGHGSAFHVLSDTSGTSQITFLIKGWFETEPVTRTSRNRRYLFT